MSTHDAEAYVVLINDEEQYSIWPAGLPVPLGWRAGVRSGSKEECLAFVRDVWTDMRPASLRRSMAEAAGE